MAAIDQYLNEIRTAVYGIEVRSAIANGIEECYRIVNIEPEVTAKTLNNYVLQTEMSKYLLKTTADGLYLTGDALGDYLSKSDASDTYATKSSLGSYLTKTSASDTYVAKTALDSYLTKTAASKSYATKTYVDEQLANVNSGGSIDLSNYLTKTDASNTYATKTALGSYLTSTTAANTYATKTALASYLTTSDAGSTYATKTSLDSYLKQSTASDIYATKTYVNEQIIANRSGNGNVNLSNYLTKTDASEIYATQTALSNYLTTNDASRMYATVTTLASYLTKTDADKLYATTSYVQGNYMQNWQFQNYHSFDYAICADVDLDIPTGVTNVNGVTGSLKASTNTMWRIYLVKMRNDPPNMYDEYITVQTSNNTYVWERIGGEGSAQIIDTGDGKAIDLSDYVLRTTADNLYAFREDLTDFVTKSYVDSAVSGESGDIGTKLKSYVKRVDADELYAPITTNSFRYEICVNSSSDIPKGVTNVYGVEGALDPGPSTMYKVYFVQMRESGTGMYEPYVTLQNGSNYIWANFGPNSLNLSDYLDQNELSTQYVSQTRLTSTLQNYLSKTDASNTYLDKDTLASTYATQQYVDEQIGTVSSGGSLNLANYLTKADAAETYVTVGILSQYATKEAAKAENDDLFLLEADEIPATTQTIIFDDNGNVKSIQHKNGSVIVRNDEFTFNKNSIKEVRTLKTGSVLTIVTNTNTLAVQTMYDAA